MSMVKNIKPGLQIPQQARSQKTMLSILAATRELLEQKDFSEISIHGIVEHAGCSVGAFYGRFKDKDSLLNALDDQFTLDVIDLIHALTGENSQEFLSLSDYISAIVRALYNLHIEQRGLIRTLILVGRTENDDRFRGRDERINAELPSVFRKLLSFGDQIKHPDPELAVRFGLVQTHFALREMVLWEHLQGSVPVSGEDLICELVRGYLCYLEYQ
jgi:AcrR family transcriptional regulator